VTGGSLYSAEDYGRVAVCAGGNSAEREISLNSGAATAQALQARGIDAELVDLDERFFTRALAGDFDRVFIVLHGCGGEDGSLQGFLDLINLPYTGSGVAASVLGMDKLLSKLLWQSAGLPTPAWKTVNSLSSLVQAAETLSLPLMVKPVSEGSSIGMSLVETEGQLADAWQTANAQNQPVMAERYINGDEYTAALVMEESLPLVRITTPHKFYDYKAKYYSDQTGYYCPAGLAPAEERALADLARQAFEVLGAAGWGRVDLMLGEDGQPWLIEVNTVPGMTDHSLVPMAAAAMGWHFEDLVVAILQSSMQRRFNSSLRRVAHG